MDTIDGRRHPTSANAGEVGAMVHTLGGLSSWAGDPTAQDLSL
jgi:hypothetical protein